MNRQERMHGKSGVKHGIYNTSKKEFQFGICEELRCWRKQDFGRRLGTTQENGDLKREEFRNKKEM